MIAILISLALGQNLNQTPIQAKQNGTPLSATRAYIINCGSGLTCTQSGSQLNMSSILSDGGSSGSGTLSTVTATSPLVSTPDGGAGVNLSFPLYQTTGAVTYYVDPTGNDNNACTASGTSACQTWNGLVAKLPRHILNSTTVNIANGTYAEQFFLSDRTFAGAFAVNGSQLQSTGLATGTATGTLTAVAPGAVALSVYTDGAQSWTTNDLRFKFMTMTSGAANGQSVLIMSNTATTITTANQFTTAPSAADSYMISAPGVIFSLSSPMSFTGLQGTGTVQANVLTMNNIQFVGTSGVSRWSADGLQLTANNLLFTMTGNGTALQTASNNVRNASNTFFTHTGFNCSGASGTTSCTSLGGGVLGLTGSFFRSASNIALTIASGTGLALSKTAFEITGTGADNEVAGAVSFRGPTFATASLATNAFWSITCGAGVLNPALRIYGTGVGTSAFNTTIQGVALNAMLVSGCPVGVSIGGQAVFNAFSTSTFTDVATGINVSNGGKVRFTTLPTFSGTFTNEFLMDGTAYTAASINALSPKIVTDMTTLSSIYLQ